MNKEIDTFYQPELVCPECGYVYKDSWEIQPGDEDGQKNCGECGVEFGWSRIIDISYTTRKLTGE